MEDLREPRRSRATTVSSFARRRGCHFWLSISNLRSLKEPCRRAVAEAHTLLDTLTHAPAAAALVAAALKKAEDREALRTPSCGTRSARRPS
jgi:hypothetical protein